jgi:hypothetical protein
MLVSHQSNRVPITHTGWTTAPPQMNHLNHQGNPTLDKALTIADLDEQYGFHKQLDAPQVSSGQQPAWAIRPSTIVVYVSVEKDNIIVPLILTLNT